MEYKSSSKGSRKPNQKRNFGDSLNYGNRMRTFGENSQRLSSLRDASPPIDPRRFQNSPPTQQAAYGQPAAITNTQFFNRRFDSTSSQSNRYAGPLRDFSNQLPVRLSQPLRRCSPLHTRRYGAPALFPLWSKSNSHNHNNKNNGNSNNFNSGYRKASRPLRNMKSEEWTGYMSYANNQTTEVNDSMIKIQNSAWKSFIERDNYMDEVKKYNSSNLNMLKIQRDIKFNEYPLSEYDDQILSCVANPGKFWATWKLLEILYDEIILKNYIASRKYSEDELKSAKFSKDLLDALLDDELDQLDDENQNQNDVKNDKENNNNVNKVMQNKSDANNNDVINNDLKDNDVKNINENEKNINNGVNDQKKKD